MKCINANTLFLQISNTVDSIDRIVSNGADNATQSYLAGYLTVYICGIYEQSIEEILIEYSSSRAWPEIENFVSNQVSSSFRNPNMNNIIKLVKQFDPSWAQALRAIDSKYKNSIDSIINNKNLIAHGGTSQVTLSDIKTFHSDARKIIETIDYLFLGS